MKSLQESNELMELELENSVALVVGGASGIGLACVHSLLREHSQVVIWDAAPTVTEIANKLDHCRAIQVDISDEAGVQQALKETVATAGPIDHLIHAAAIGSGRFGRPFTRLQPADWSRVLSVNINGLVNVAHAVAPGMVQQGRGSMVFVSSVAGQIGSPTDPPYSASKAAGINFAQVMARDLASQGIRVNTVCPGMVRTPLNRSVWLAWNAQQPEEDRMSYEEWGDRKVRQLIPLGTWQQPEDVADMIVFLCSSRASQVTGQTINVDGGYVMHW